MILNIWPPSALSLMRTEEGPGAAGISAVNGSASAALGNTLPAGQRIVHDQRCHSGLSTSGHHSRDQSSIALRTAGTSELKVDDYQVRIEHVIYIDAWTNIRSLS